MYNYCIFLRGINVNGIKIKMDNLKKSFHSFGYTDVKTILATGNVVLNIDFKTLKKGIDLIKTDIENSLSKYFDYEAYIIIKDKKELEKIVQFSDNFNKNSDLQYYVILNENKKVVDEINVLYESMTHESNEELHILDDNIFWIVPKGMTLKSNFGSKLLGQKKYKDKITSRNLNTINKILNAME